MAILTLKDGFVVATHTDDQWDEIQNKYPGCEIVAWAGQRVCHGDPDPRTTEQVLECYRSTAARRLESEYDAIRQQGVQVDGHWMRTVDSAVDDYMRILARIGLRPDALTPIQYADGVFERLPADQLKAKLGQYSDGATLHREARVRAQIMLDQATTREQFDAVTMAAAMAQAETMLQPPSNTPSG